MCVKLTGLLLNHRGARQKTPKQKQQQKKQAISAPFFSPRRFSACLLDVCDKDFHRSWPLFSTCLHEGRLWSCTPEIYSLSRLVKICDSFSPFKNHAANRCYLDIKCCFVFLFLRKITSSLHRRSWPRFFFLPPLHPCQIHLKVWESVPAVEERGRRSTQMRSEKGEKNPIDQKNKKNKNTVCARVEVGEGSSKSRSTSSHGAHCNPQATRTSKAKKKSAK